MLHITERPRGKPSVDASVVLAMSKGRFKTSSQQPTQADLYKVCTAARERDIHVIIVPRVQRECTRHVNEEAIDKLQDLIHRFDFVRYAERDWQDELPVMRDTDDNVLADRNGGLLILRQLCDIVNSGRGAGLLVSSDHLLITISSAITVRTRLIVVIYLREQHGNRRKKSGTTMLQTDRSVQAGQSA